MEIVSLTVIPRGYGKGSYRWPNLAEDSNDSPADVWGNLLYMSVVVGLSRNEAEPTCRYTSSDRLESGIRNLFQPQLGWNKTVLATYLFNGIWKRPGRTGCMHGFCYCVFPNAYSISLLNGCWPLPCNDLVGFILLIFPVLLKSATEERVGDEELASKMTEFAAIGTTPLRKGTRWCSD